MFVNMTVLCVWRSTILATV